MRDPTFFWCDDYQAFYTPLFEEIVRSWHDGEWPLLSRNSWCVPNLAGEFQNGTFSPPFNALLVAIWALPLSIPLKAAALSITYLVWLAMGVFVLGRLRGLTAPLATTAALATSLSGWVITWAATDWLPFLTGFSWVPWVWWALQTAMANDSVWKRWLRPALCVALMVTQGNAFAPVMVAVITVWLGLQAIVPSRNWHALGPLAAAGLLGAGLSAPAWWLLSEMLHSSTRGDWGNKLHLAWSVPWRAWPGLVLPSFVTPWRDWIDVPVPHASMELASGLVPVAALGAALLFRPVGLFRKLRWEILLLGVCVLIVTLPSIGQFRWSFRWLPLFHLVLALTGAAAVQAGMASRAALCGAGLVGATWAGTLLLGQSQNAVLGFWLCGLALAWPVAERWLPRTLGQWVPAAIVTLSLSVTFWYLPTHQRAFKAKYSFTDGILNPAPLDTSRLYLGLYSFGEILDSGTRPPDFGNIVRPVNSMGYAGLRFLNGYSSFSGGAVKDLFRVQGFLDPGVAASLAGPDGKRLLDFLGVDGIVFSREYAGFADRLGPEWLKIADAPEGVAYHREPRRFTPVKVLTFLFDRPGVPLADPVVELIAERRNSVTVQITPQPEITALELGAEAAQRAVAPIAFVRPYLAGYRAFLNGKPVPVREYRGILPIVELPASASGKLELLYRPRGLTDGLIVTGLTAVIMLLIAVVGSLRSKGRLKAATPDAA
jgi:hypothetical protein